MLADGNIEDFSPSKVMVYLILIFNWFDWQSIKTKNFTVFYKPGYEYEARQALKNLEYYRQKVIDLTGNETHNLPVVIEDIGTQSNGFANPLFYNIHIFTYWPGFGSSSGGVEDWYRTVGVHEYTHIGHLTKTSGLPRILTSLLGAPFQVNMYSPGWIIEGITVFSESQISPYEGRLNDGLFDSYMGARISAQKFPSIIEATNEPFSFPYGQSYLYGGEFFNFLWGRYGKESFSQFFKIYGSYPWAFLSAFLPGIGLDVAAKRVYGKTFPELFTQWQTSEKERFADWPTADKRVTKKGWYISSLVKHNNNLYFAREFPVKIDAFKYHNNYEIVELDVHSEREKVLTRLTSSVTTPLKIFNDNLYYATLELKRAGNISYNGFGATSVLHKMNLLTHKDEVLIKDDIRSFCILQDSSILYAKDRRHSFGSEIWRYDKGMIEKIWEGDYLIYELETDGNWIAISAARRFENSDLYTFDLTTKEFTLLLSTPWTEANLSPSQRGRIRFTANFDRTYALYEIDIAKKSIWRLSKGGFATSVAGIGDGLFEPETLYYIGLNNRGYDIYKKSNCPQHYDLPNWQKSAKPDFESSRITTKQGSYFDVLKTLLPSARVPIILPSDTTFKSWRYGAIFLGGDATTENSYGIFFAYDQLKNLPVCQTLCYSSFFTPLQINFIYNYNDYLSVTTCFPFINRLSPGFSQVSLLLNGRSYNDDQRKEITPGFKIGYRLPATTLSFMASCPIEKQIWKSTINRTGYVANISLSQVIFNGELKLNGDGYIDMQNPDTPAISIRGYKPVHTPRGAVFTTEYAHHLLNLRRGLWNPNIYFEDILDVVFFDLGIINNKELYYSCGVEIKLEAKTGFGFISFVPKFGLAVNKEKKFKIFFAIN